MFGIVKMWNYYQISSCNDDDFPLEFMHESYTAMPTALPNLVIKEWTWKKYNLCECGWVMINSIYDSCISKININKFAAQPRFFYSSN